MHVTAWQESKFTKFGEEMKNFCEVWSTFWGAQIFDPRYLGHFLSDHHKILHSLGSDQWEIFHGMLLTKSPKQPKFCRNRLKSMGDIHNQNFVLPNNWTKVH